MNADRSEHPAQEANALRNISLEEIGKHRTPDDAWMVCNSRVYNVSGWKEGILIYSGPKHHQSEDVMHPGGHVIFTHAGDDFTDIFAAFHPSTAYAALQPFLVGTLDRKSVLSKPDKQLKFEKSYRELRAKLLVMGMFEPK